MLNKLLYNRCYPNYTSYIIIPNASAKPSALDRVARVIGSTGTEPTRTSYPYSGLRRVIPDIQLLVIHGGRIPYVTQHDSVDEFAIESCFHESRWEGEPPSLHYFKERDAI